MDNAEFLKKFEELTVKAENLHIAMDIIALKPPTFSEELKEMASDVEEIKQLEDEVKIFFRNKILINFIEFLA